MKLINSEILSGSRIRNSYKISNSPLEYCKKIMNMPDFQPVKMRLSLEGEEMQPDRRLLITSLDDLMQVSKEETISSCTFQGTYSDKAVDIVVDYGLNTLVILSKDSELIATIQRSLDGDKDVDNRLPS